jgi:dTDP-4-dehydrorhamnose reductase
LITGVAGVAGYNAFLQFRERYGDQVIGQRTVRNWPLQVDGIVACDLDDTSTFARLLEDHNIRTIINCGGSCALKACELDPQMAHRLNVERVDHLLNAIDGTGIRLIHLSIDLVYSGVGEGDYVETDMTDPVTIYGKTMVAAEDLVMTRNPESCILRISLPMGISFNGHAGAIDWIQSRFAKDKPATLYFDEIRTPTYVDCLNEVIEMATVRNLSGIFHAGGPVKLSLYEIAQIVNRVGGYNPDLLMGCPRIDAGPVPPRAGNVTMNCEKLIQTLGKAPFCQWPLDSGLLPTSRTWHYERGSNAGSLDAIEALLYRRPDSKPQSSE